MLANAAKEDPRDDQATREIEMMPDWKADFSLQPSEFGFPEIF